MHKLKISLRWIAALALWAGGGMAAYAQTGIELGNRHVQESIEISDHVVFGTTDKVDGAQENMKCVAKPAICRQKKTVPLRERFFDLRAWRCPTLTWGDPTLPSALSVFTSEFEMESGGSHSLMSPGKPVG